MTISDIIWLAVFVVFLLVEAGSVSLTSMWFALGGLAALIVSRLGGQMWLQVTVFLAVSVVLLLCLRPLVRKFIAPRIVRTNVDGIIGARGVITAPVDNLAAQGQVVLNGQPWTARSTSGEYIETGVVVRVDRIEGVKAYVSPVVIPENACMQHS